MPVRTRPRSDATKALRLLAVLVSTASLAACAAASNAGEPDAAAIVAAMAQRDSHLSASRTLTVATDGYHLLGRPGQYTSRSLFNDDQIFGPGSVVSAQAQADGAYAVGDVEVFRNAEDTQKRARYVASIRPNGLWVFEYDYVAGTALLRVSRLTSAQAAAVAADFSAAMGKPAVPVAAS